MNELSLFTGAGGGLLATTHLMGFRCVGAVEIDKYCCGVLEQRQQDGHLEAFPVWQMDIRDFNARVAGEYAGMVDAITAGFPCQPFSVAGKRKGEADDRNLWPATAESIRIIRPRFVLLENVPGLLANEYFSRIIADLAEMGYVGSYGCLSAQAVGACHRRERLWVVAYAESAI